MATQYPAGPADPRIQGPVTPQHPLLGGVYSNRANYAPPSRNAFASEVFGPPSDGSGGGAAPATDYGVQTLPDGRTFNLNDPAQRLAYASALQEILGSQRDQLLSRLDESVKAGEQQSAAAYQQSLSALDQNLADLGAQAKTWTQDYLKTVQGFNEGKGQGDVNRQNRFASLSPNAFQSSQATSQQYADQKYQQGLGDLATQANDTVGLNYVNAFDPAAAPSTANLDPGSTFGRGVGDVGTQRKGLENAFNAFQQGQAVNVQHQKSDIFQQYQDSLNGQRSSLGQIDISQHLNPFQYGTASVKPVQAAAPDLNAYTPYTTFGSLSDTAAPGSAYVKPVAAANSFTKPGLDSWLGRTNTTVPQAQKNSWFDSWMGRAATA